MSFRNLMDSLIGRGTLTIVPAHSSQWRIEKWVPQEIMEGRSLDVILSKKLAIVPIRNGQPCGKPLIVSTWTLAIEGDIAAVLLDETSKPVTYTAKTLPDEFWAMSYERPFAKMPMQRLYDNEVMTLICSPRLLTMDL